MGVARAPVGKHALRRSACTFVQIGVAMTVSWLTACTTTAASHTGAWQSLFNGHSTAGWRNVGKATLDPRWQAVDDALVLTAAGGGDIVSDAQFGDFELELDWQLAPGGNSGVFYRASDADPAWRLAAEYQLLDDAAAADRFVASHRAGAIYDLIAPAGAALRAPDAYNHARIVACGTHVEHWLNGVRVAAYDTASDDWRKRLAASKFNGSAEFAAARRGHIAIQDHGAVLRLRNLRARALMVCPESMSTSHVARHARSPIAFQAAHHSCERHRLP